MPSMTRKNDFIIWLYLTPDQQRIYGDFLSLDSVKEVGFYIVKCVQKQNLIIHTWLPPFCRKRTCCTVYLYHKGTFKVVDCTYCICLWYLQCTCTIHVTIISVKIHVLCLCCSYMYWCTHTICILELMELVVINVNRHYFVYELDNDKWQISLLFSCWWPRSRLWWHWRFWRRSVTTHACCPAELVLNSDWMENMGTYQHFC